MTPDSNAPTEARSGRASLLRAAGLVLAVLLVYWPSLRGEFVYDDLLIIQRNPQITSFAHLPQLFGSSYWDFLDPESASHVGYYRPLTMVLLTAGYVLGDGAPMVFHALSLLVYCLACLAAWRFAVRLTRSEAIGFGAALLFALHPLHVESVAWISALHDPLFALFGFLALSQYMKWRDEGSGSGAWRSGPWLAGLFFLLALLSKDAAVALLPVAIALDLGRRAGKAREAAPLIVRPLQAYSPFLASFALYFALRVAVFGDLMAGFDRTTTDFGVGAGRLLMLRVELLGGAVKLLAWPAELNLFRPFQPELPLGSASLITGVVGSLVLLSTIALAAIKRKRPQLAMLLLIPAGIAPVLVRVESLGTFPLSDRFLFVPVIGFTALVAWVLVTRLPAKLAAACLMLLALLFGLRTNAQLPVWQSEEAMFRAGVAQNPRNPNVYWGLGRILLEDFKHTGLLANLVEARECFDRGMELLDESQHGAGDIFATQDDHLQTNLGLGWTLLYEAEIDPFHDYKTARVVFERVIEYMPKNESGWIGLGVAWLSEGDPNEAGVAFRKAIQLNDKSAEAHFNMGLLYMRIEEWSMAVAEFRRSAQIRSGSFQDLNHLARALQESGQPEEAMQIARQALEHFPGQPDPMVLLGIGEALKGDHAKAVEWFDRALAVRENHGAAHLHRGKSLIALGQRNAAVKALERACELLPSTFEPHYNLTVLLRSSSHPEAALGPFLVAYRLRPRGELDVLLTKVAEEMHEDDIGRLTLLATIDADRGDVGLAERWARKALELDPDHAPTKYLLGVLLKQKPEFQEAGDLFVEGYDLLRSGADELTSSYQAQMEFAEVLLLTNQEMAAEVYLRRALDLLPTQGDMQADQRRKAAQTIQTALEKIEELKNAGPLPVPAED